MGSRLKQSNWFGTIGVVIVFLLLSGCANQGAAANNPTRSATQPATKPERKRRGTGYGRACAAEPTATVEHAVDICPDCGQPLTGGWFYSAHEVIDLPMQPATVTRHVRLAR